MSQFPVEHSRPTAETAGEVVALRNYDMDTAHRVWVNVVDDGERAFETTRRLAAGAAASIQGLPPGEYDIEVGVDDIYRTVERCRVGDGPRRTALVEIGNGIVSITQGHQ